jgi:hypothetical protein
MALPIQPAAQLSVPALAFADTAVLSHGLPR